MTRTQWLKSITANKLASLLAYVDYPEKHKPRFRAHRNSTIAVEYLSGVSFMALGARFNMGSSRVKDIFDTMMIIGFWIQQKIDAGDFIRDVDEDFGQINFEELIRVFSKKDLLPDIFPQCARSLRFNGHFRNYEQRF